MTKNVELSKQFILHILNNGDRITPEAFYDIFTITHGDNELLLEYLKAVVSIMNNAIDELEKGVKENEQ